MFQSGKLTVLVASLLFTVPILAKAPASAPAGSSGLCKDGTYSSATAKSGACSGHGGVKKWYGPAAAEKSEKAGKAAKSETAPKPGKAEEPAKAEPRTSPAATVPAPVAAPAPAPAPAAARQVSTPAAPAAGGGNGRVWVKADSKVYHCPGDKGYGTTKSGSYMSESSAIAQGYHADHGKACH
jgi:hypothetical protein